MEKERILEILRGVESGKTSADEAMAQLRIGPFEDLGYAKVDHHRSLRQGAAEVIYGAGKTPAQISGIVDAMRRMGQDTILITRMDQEAANFVSQQHPLTYHEMGRVGIVGELPSPDGDGKIVIATGGTSDMPVAEEAALTAEALGNEVLRLYDVGVSGIHRLLSNMDYIIAPISADRVVLESTLRYMTVVNDVIRKTGVSNIKGTYLVWNMVDGREKSELYEVYEQVIAELGLQVLKTFIPDSKRFRRELSAGHRPLFRSTLFPADRSLLRGSNIDALTDEVLTLLNLRDNG